MRKKRNRAGATRSGHRTQNRGELPPERAFVVQLTAQAELPRRFLARVEHITSGQVARVGSARDLVGFMAKVLDNRPPDEDLPCLTLQPPARMYPSPPPCLIGSAEAGEPKGTS